MRRLGIALLAFAALLLAVAVSLPLLGAPGAAPLPAAARSVAIGGGLALNVDDLAAAGEPIVLVHGLPSNIGDWADVPARLHAAGHRVVVYDRIGYGHSSRAAAGTDAYTLAANARQLQALLDALAIDRAVLVGWSYGGGIVQQLAIDAPERIARLVLLGSVGPAIADVPPDPVGRLARSPLGPPIFRWLTSVAPLARAVVDDSLAAVFAGAAHVPPGWSERTAAQLAMPGTIDAWLAEERAAGYDALRPESIAAPALVLHGDDDRAVPVAVAEDLARRLPHATLRLVPGGSHMLPATHAALVADAIHEAPRP